MSDFNFVLMSGRITRDAEERAAGQHSLIQFTMANNHGVKKDGQWVDVAEFFDFELFDKQGLLPYLKKGAKFIVTGRLHQNKWEDKTTGEKKTRVTIQVQSVEFGSAPSGKAIPAEGNGVLAETKESEEFPADIPF